MSFIDILLTPLTNNPQMPMTQTILNTAEPTIVPTPTSPLATNIPRIFSQRISCSMIIVNVLPIIAVNNSGADEPPAINVAPATSSSRFNAY